MIASRTVEFFSSYKQEISFEKLSNNNQPKRSAFVQAEPFVFVLFCKYFLWKNQFVSDQ